MSQETTGNEKFLNILFENLGGVELGWDKDQFINRMATDAAYNDKVYNRFIDIYGDQEFTYEDFEYGTGLKKKDEEEVQDEALSTYYNWANEASAEELVAGTEDFTSPLRFNEDGSVIGDEEAQDLFNNYKTKTRSVLKGEGESTGTSLSSKYKTIESYDFQIPASLYAEGYDFANQVWDVDVLENYQTQIEAGLHEMYPEVFDPQGNFIGIYASYSDGYKERFKKEALATYLSTLDPESTKNAWVAQQEQKFVDSYIEAARLEETTGFNLTKFAEEWEEKYKKPTQNIRNEWLTGEEGEKWRNDRLPEGQSYDNAYIEIPVDSPLFNEFKELRKAKNNIGTRFDGVMVGNEKKPFWRQTYYNLGTAEDPNWVTTRPIGGGSDYRQSGYMIHTEDFLEIIQGNKVRDVGREFRDNQISELKSEFLKNINVSELIPGYDEMSEDQKEDAVNEMFDKVDDYLYNHHNIKANISGDKRYNERNVLFEMGAGFSNSLGSLIVDPIEYWVAGTFGVDHQAQVRRRQGFDQQLFQEGRMGYQYNGVVSSFGAGDFANGFIQLAVSLAETAPQIGLIAGTSLIPGGAAIGIAWSGFAGATNQWTSSLNEDELRMMQGMDAIFQSNLARLGSSLVAGGSDAAFAAVGNAIFLKSAARASGIKQISGLAFKQTGKTFIGRATSQQGRRHLKEMVKGYIKEKGISMNQEGLEELVTSVVSDVTNYALSGASAEQELKAEEVLNNALESYVIGAAAGAGFDGLGNLFGRSSSAARGAGDVANLNHLSLYRAEEEAIKDQLKNKALTPKSRALLQDRLNAINVERNSIKNSRSEYYAMIELRYGRETLNQILDLDNKIYKTNIEFNRSEVDASKTALKSKYEQLILERKEITDSVDSRNQEAGLTEALTETEQSNASQALLDQTVERTDQDALNAQQDLEALKERYNQIPPEARTNQDRRALIEARKIADTTKRKADAVNELKSQLDAATNAANLDPSDANVANAELARQELASELGLRSSKDPALSDAVELLSNRRRDASNRKSNDWIANAEQNLESSNLTSDQINDILASDNYASLTAENPPGQNLTEQENAERNRQAEALLQEMGLTYHKVVGDYDGGENSFLVEGMTREQAAEFANKMEQESVAHKDGLVKADGSIQLFDGDAKVNNNANSFFSSIKDADGNIIRYQSTTTESFQDADGNDITADDYATGKDTEAEVVAQTDYNEFSFNEDGTLDIDENSPILSGLTADQRSDLKNITESISGIGALSNFKIRIHSSDSFNNSISQDGGGFADFTNEIIHLSPDNILKNIEAEGKLGLGKEKTFTETVLEEVMHSVMTPIYMEMTSTERTALIKDLESINIDKDLKIRAEAKGKQYLDDNIKANTSMLPEYMRFDNVEDLDAFLASGNATETDIMVLTGAKQDAELIRDDEVITEYLAALVANPELQRQPSLLKKILNFINTHFFGNKKLPESAKLSKDSSAMTIIQNFSAAKAGGKIDANITLDKLKFGRGSKRIFPNQLPADSSFEIIFSKVGRDAISRYKSKTFKNKNSFILWARGATSDGTDFTTYSDFSYNGDPVAVNAMAKWNFSKPYESYQARQDRIEKEKRYLLRDLVTEANRQRKEGKSYEELSEQYGPNQAYIGNAYAIVAELAGLQPNVEALYGKPAREFDGLFEQIKELSLYDLKQVQKKLMPEKFNENPVESGRSSSQLRAKDLSKENLAPGKMEEIETKIKDVYLDAGLDEAEADKRMKQKHSYYKALTMAYQTVNQIPAGLSYADRSSPEIRTKIVGSIKGEFEAFQALNPEFIKKAENFFSDYKQGKTEFFESLKRDLSSGKVKINPSTGVKGNFNVSEDILQRLDSYSPVYDVLVALTSPQRQADVNVSLANSIFTEAVRNLAVNFSGNPKTFNLINTDVINRMITKSEASLRLEGVTGLGGGNLQVVGKLLNNFNEVAKDYIKKDGSFDADKFKTDMSVRETDSKNNSGLAEYPVAGSLLSSRAKDGKTKGRAVKVGTFAVTLMDPPSKLGDKKWAGDDYLTQDSHVMDFLSKHDGTGGLDFVNSIPAFNAARLRDLVNKSRKKGKDIKKQSGKQLLNTACKLINDGQASKKLIEEVDNIISKFPGREMSREAKSFRYYNVKQLASEINKDRDADNQITIKQLGQMMYAMDQVSYVGGGVDGNNIANLQKYTPYGPIMSKLRSEDSDHVLAMSSVGRASSRIVGEINNEMDPAEIEMRAANRVDKHQEQSYEKLTMSRNSFGLIQMELPFVDDNGLKVKASDSRLFRDRSADEALSVTIKGKSARITDQGVNIALSTDKTSQRILNKGKELKLGQKVGVRLNLNVAKNTGMPVQTVHDKTASGEALTYSGAVMLRNVNFTVNQNARNKIVTFQDNKNPMASVDGDFISEGVEGMDYSGVKAVFNPFKHNTFVDVSGRPIKSASEVVVVGNNVFMRGDIEYYDFNDPIVKAGKEETAEQRAKRVKRGPKYDAAVKRFQAYSHAVMGVDYASFEDAKVAYDNMDIDSQVALNDSEVAQRAEEAVLQGRASDRIRKTAERGAEIYNRQRNDILRNPENYISKQNIQENKNKLSSMDTSDLVNIMTDDSLGRLSSRNDDMGVLAGLELINRAIASGNADAVPGLIEELSKIGTTAGRLLRHFAELKSSTPAGMVMMIQKEVERRGNTLSEKSMDKLTNLASGYMEAHAKVDELTKQAIRGEDVETELVAAVEALKKVENSLETFTNATVERGWGTIGTMLMQGNLLTPMSQITNVVANLFNAALMIPRDIVAMPIERVLNLFGFESPMKRNYSINAYMYGLRKFGSGFVESLEAVVTGQEKDVTEWRIHRGFAPFRSIMAAFGKGEDLPLGPDGKASLRQRSKLFVQGTLGIPAETMFRLLGIGDTPFRRMVEGIELYQAGVSMGLEGDKLTQFLKHPTKEQRERAQEEGRKLTFQEQGAASEMGEQFVRFLTETSGTLFGWIPGVNGREFGKFLVRSQLPYVRTPANILYETLTFTSPVIAIPRVMSDLKKGDTRSASQNMGKLIVGQSVAYSVELMIREGLISGAIEYGDDEERNIAYDQFPPSSVNVSGLKRFLRGEPTAKQPDDYFINYSKLGIFGAIIGARVKATRPDDDSLGKDPFIANRMIRDAFGVTAFSTMAHMMDQSFLQGVSSFTQLLSSGDADDFERKFERWIGSTFNAVSAVALPNTLSALYRQTREYMPDVRVDKNLTLEQRILQKFKYTLQDRTFSLGDVPIRVNWKGEQIRQKPEGAVPGGYYLFDVFKARKGEADAVSNEIWRLYEQTEDLTKACGTPYFATTRKISPPKIKTKKERAALAAIGRDYTFLNDEDFMNSKVIFSIEDVNSLMEVAGKERYNALDMLINSKEYQEMSDSEKVEAMNDIADDFNSIKEFTKNANGDVVFRPQTIAMLDIMQKIYDNERQEED